MARRWRRDRGALTALAILVAGALLAGLLGYLEYAQHRAYDHKERAAKNDEYSQGHDWWEDTLPQWLMAIFGTAATAVSLVAVWKVSDTLRATRDGNRIARRNGRIQSRAYVNLDSVRLENTTGEYSPTVVVSFKNFGQSPALKVKHSMKVTFVFGGDGPRERAQTKESSDEGQPLGPTQSRSTTSVLGSDIAESMLRKIVANRAAKLFVHGRIEYLDIFDMPHFTTYRGHIYVGDDGLKDTDLFVVSEKGNDAT